MWDISLGGLGGICGDMGEGTEEYRSASMSTQQKLEDDEAELSVLDISLGGGICGEMGDESTGNAAQRRGVSTSESARELPRTTGTSTLSISIFYRFVLIAFLSAPVSHTHGGLFGQWRSAPAAVTRIRRGVFKRH